jgi:hypothetical protein
METAMIERVAIKGNIHEKDPLHAAALNTALL